jgi:3-hydroxybutyryl-CoA dehydrogenase
MKQVGIVGLGAMGLGIAQVFAQAGVAVIATDQQSETRGAALARLRAALEARVSAGKLAQSAVEETLSHLTITEGLGGFAKAGLIVEAVIEDQGIKQTLFRALEAVTGADTILATNTSALSVGALALGLARPDRLLGLHFFNPAPVMRLVELVAHPSTASGALAEVRALAERAGKTVIQCADRPGFVVNRCARPFYGEALAMLEEGRSASDIDAAMLAAGYRIGPFSLIDLVGADINLAATEGLARAMNHHPRYHLFQALRDQVAKGDLGRKTGRGFLFPDLPGPTPADAPAIRLRIEATLANEAASLLAEGSISADDIDTALKLGLNFPRGPFESARLLGLPAIQAELSRLATAAPAHLTGRYRPSPALTAL